MSVAENDPPFRCETLLIVGVGLIGGAIAQHARQLGVAKNVIGLGRDASRLRAAEADGVIDRGVTTAGDVGACDLAVVCTPVDRVVADVQSLAGLARPPRVITDAGSVKEAICAPLHCVGQFVGSHPLAGSEKSGFEHASAVQFKDRICVLTPVPEAPADVLRAVRGFWEAIGMKTVTLDARTHDQVLARTSHFPHVIAYALASLLEPGDAPFVAGGFRDTTRIAASDPALWTSILMANRDAVLETFRRHRQKMAMIEEALASEDAELLRAGLLEGQRVRQSLNS
ncbi:prephenate dehydrogenase [Caulifigura coniformis]|uniref:Prephenate dehydrogenase n=1 Tax=Caulifigura coniformis TaxID=2527983 RepID=A0A517SAF7_9PLAN|nr:prephenate dehydrogenase/arogenate dehydrogenase family protein [Caulifigura coniformis]QDT53109.1 prephenate dehydrogenase [Caulifigura coniformis]